MYSIGNPRNPAAIFGGGMQPIGNPATAGRIALARMMQQQGGQAPAGALSVNPVQLGQPDAPQSMPQPTPQPGPPPPIPYDPSGIKALGAPDYSPVQHPLQMLARALNPIAANYQQGQNLLAERAQKDAQQTALAAAMRAMQGGDTTAALNIRNLSPEAQQAILAQALKPPPVKDDYTIGDTRYSGKTNQPLATNTAAPKADEVKRDVGPEVWTVARDGRGSESLISTAPRWEPEKPAGGPFVGNGMDAQALNIVAAYEQRKAQGEPTTPQDDYVYALARRQVEQPRVVGTPETGFNQVTPPPLPQYPGAGGQPQAGAPQAQVKPLTAPAPQPPSDRQRGQAEGINNAITAVQALIDDVETNGLQTGGLGEAGGRQSTLVNNAKLQLKNAYDLGALQGADMGLLLDILGDPTSFGTLVAGMGGPGNFLGKARTTMQTFAPQIRNLPEAAFPGGKYPEIRNTGNGSRGAGDRFPGFTATPVGP